MSTLQEEMYRQILKSEGIEDKAYEEANPISSGICRLHAIHAAGIAMKWIEKAFRAGENYEYGSQFGPVPNNRPDLKTWLKENGLTPTEPDTKEPKQ